jgi:hypothetical protein
VLKRGKRDGEVCVVARQHNVFRQAQRIIETMQNGPGIARVEIDMRITIIPGTPEQPAGDNGTAHDLDRELEEFRTRHGQS